MPGDAMIYMYYLDLGRRVLHHFPAGPLKISTKRSGKYNGIHGGSGDTGCFYFVLANLEHSKHST